MSPAKRPENRLRLPDHALCLVFCLATGAVLEIAMGRYRGKQTGELSLFQAINHLHNPGDILLADHYYAALGTSSQAIRGGDRVVMRSHHKRPTDFRRGFKQGVYDQIVANKKPPRWPVWMSISEYQQCDDFILVRHVSNAVKRKGFRVKRIIVATTMLDASKYTVGDLDELYCMRWPVKLDIRSLKTHMQMEHLRLESPAMMRKKIYAHLIVYNLIRDLIVLASIIIKHHQRV